jgi:hypothetical protein
MLLGMTHKRTTINDLTPLELRRKISVAEAAAMNAISLDTFKRHYSHLIRRISKRRQAVELRDAILLPPAKS